MEFNDVITAGFKPAGAFWSIEHGFPVGPTQLHASDKAVGSHPGVDVLAAPVGDCFPIGSELARVRLKPEMMPLK
jgi:hypothetical protein